MKSASTFLLSAFFVCALLITGPNSHADTASDTESLLNWAQNTYPELFPSAQATQTLNPWIYRYYPETGIYAGVNTGDLGVYVMGGPWGDSPTYIDALVNLMGTVNKSDNKSSITACDTSNIPDGLSYSQSGNVVTVTTNGACITMSTDANYCDAPAQSQATGLSVLTSNTVTSIQYSGITFPDNIPFDIASIVGSSAKACIINAPTEFTSTTINADICIDISDAFKDLSAVLSASGVSITPPVTMASASTSTFQTVSDCFSTDADIIVDQYTGETWNKESGTWTQIIFAGK